MSICEPYKLMMAGVRHQNCFVKLQSAICSSILVIKSIDAEKVLPEVLI